MNSPAGPPDARADRWAAWTARALGAAVALALSCLVVRAAVRLDLSWDTFAYHLPFAAIRGGLNVPYEMPWGLRARFEGFPPLPHLAQGLLWRATGAVNAAGLPNVLVFLAFLAFCHRALRAPWWLVAAVSLSAPLVLIHTTVLYVDLFGNALLAMATAGLLLAAWRPERVTVPVLSLAALGAAGAAWSKYQLVPVAGLALVGLAVAAGRRSSRSPVGRRNAAAVLGAAALLASAPYVKNLAVHGNPFWPVPFPGAPGLFRWTEDTRADAMRNRPAEFPRASGPELFVRSLLEVGVPTSYPDRARWVVDQGSTGRGHRLGGFWGPGVALFLALLVGTALRLDPVRGRRLSVAMALLLAFAALFPQSHELRYFLFLPLTWAAGLGILFPELRARFPRLALAVVCLVAAAFLSMIWINRGFLRVERIGIREAAKTMGVEPFWARLGGSRLVCAVRMAPKSMLLTGPTLREFPVRDAVIEELCPEGSLVVAPEGVRPVTVPATAAGTRDLPGGTPGRESPVLRRGLDEGRALLRAGRPVLALESAARLVRAFPTAAEAYAVIAAARAAVGDDEDALWASAVALGFRADVPLARRVFAEEWARATAGSFRPHAAAPADALVEESLADLRAGRFDDSLELAARAVRAEPRRADGWERVCEAAIALGRRADAVRACSFAVERAPGEARSRERLEEALRLGSADR